MIIGFTGTQAGMTAFQKIELAKILKLKECSEFIHGDCIGADEEGNYIATRECNVNIISIHPPDNPKKRAFCFDSNRFSKGLTSITPFKKVLILREEEEDNLVIQVRWHPILPYLERNKHIVDNSALMIACPKEHKHTVRSGTWSTIRYAWHTQKDIIIIPPMEVED